MLSAYSISLFTQWQPHQDSVEQVWLKTKLVNDKNQDKNNHNDDSDNDNEEDVDAMFLEPYLQQIRVIPFQACQVIFVQNNSISWDHGSNDCHIFNWTLYLAMVTNCNQNTLVHNNMLYLPLLQFNNCCMIVPL